VLKFPDNVPAELTEPVIVDSIGDVSFTVAHSGRYHVVVKTPYQGCVDTVDLTLGTPIDPVLDTGLLTLETDEHAGFTIILQGRRVGSQVYVYIVYGTDNGAVDVSQWNYTFTDSYALGVPDAVNYFGSPILGGANARVGEVIFVCDRQDGITEGPFVPPQLLCIDPPSGEIEGVTAVTYMYTTSSPWPEL
jgi:hypothetical protein